MTAAFLLAQLAIVAVLAVVLVVEKVERRTGLKWVPVLRRNGAHSAPFKRPPCKPDGLFLPTGTEMCQLALGPRAGPRLSAPRHPTTLRGWLQHRVPALLGLRLPLPRSKAVLKLPEDLPRPPTKL